MAFILTYTNLYDEIIKYVKRTDDGFTTSIPLFIMLGQRRLARELKILGEKTFITDLLIPGQQQLQKPNDWLNDSTFNIGTNVGTDTLYNTRVQVLERSYEYCRIYWPNPTQTAQPKYYADYNFTYWLITPTPDQAYPYEIAYYAVPQLIDETVSTNWFTINAPDIVLYACLLETAVFLKDDDRIAAWKSYYDGAKAALTNEDMKRIYDNFSKRTV